MHAGEPEGSLRGDLRLSNLFKAQAVIIMAVLMFVGCSAMTGRQSPSEAVSDSAITTKVKSNLLVDSVVGALAIDVDTTDGVVSLNGLVDYDLASVLNFVGVVAGCLGDACAARRGRDRALPQALVWCRVAGRLALV